MMGGGRAVLKEPEETWKHTGDLGCGAVRCGAMPSGNSECFCFWAVGRSLASAGIPRGAP
jgi:hypothetical protein